MPIIAPETNNFFVGEIPTLQEATSNSQSVFVKNDTDIGDILPKFVQCDLIVIDFPAITDGRGLSLAKSLRDAGYQGRLRAKGEITPDQYPMALLCGFNEVEISEERLKRQPREQWQALPRVHLWRERLRACSIDIESNAL